MKKNSNRGPDPDPEGIAPMESNIEAAESKPIQEDAVFGEIQEGETNYRDVSSIQLQCSVNLSVIPRQTNIIKVSWLGTTALMIKTQIGLGVLSMPKVFDTLGIIPGIILLIVIAGMTTWSNWIIGVFKLKHPSVYGIDDVGKMLFGRIGFELFGFAYTLCKLFN